MVAKHRAIREVILAEGVEILKIVPAKGAHIKLSLRYNDHEYTLFTSPHITPRKLKNFVADVRRKKREIDNGS